MSSKSSIVFDTHSPEFVAWMSNVWKMNDERNKGLRYPDGTPKTFYPEKPWLNKFGVPHRIKPCPECGQWECDPEGVGHYRG